MPARGAHTVVALPLSTGGVVIGAINLVFREVRLLADAEMEFLDILANACAQSVGRINAQEEAARQRSKLEFLAEVLTPSAP